jgi:hypothetical protein
MIRSGAHHGNVFVGGCRAEPGKHLDYVSSFTGFSVN